MHRTRPTRPSSEPFAGTERFVLEGCLGEGGMGAVYRAFDRERGAIVALKTLTHVDPMGIYQFKEEFRALTDLLHPNVVQLYELVGHGGAWFFTMELVDGSNFLEWVRYGARSMPNEGPTSMVRRASSMAPTLDAAALEMKTAPMPSDAPIAPEFLRPSPLPPSDHERLRDALRQLAEGVHAIHGAGKLHRDIKPSNVMVTTKGRIVVLDFGLVRSFEQGAPPEKENYFLGTPAYMAPEQAALRVAVPASDWYAVGTMLYESLTGRLPFEGKAYDIMLQKDRAEAPAPSEFTANVPEDLEALCLDLLRQNPEARPSGDEVLRRLAARPSLAPRSKHLTPNGRAPFVGRAAELGALEAALADVRTGKPRTVLVQGRSGMGKSALVAAFLERARRGGALVLSGRCYERESVPFKALDAVVDALTHHLAGLDPEVCASVLPIGVSDLARVFPVLRTMPALDTPPSSQFGDGHLQRHRAFAAMRELFGALGKSAPLVVHVDDLQWGDADSAELLAETLAQPDAPPMLLLASLRTGVGEGPLLEALRGTAPGRDLLDGATTIAVDQLSEDAAIELAAHLGGPEIAARGELARTIAREAGGSPLFVAELVRHAEARASRGELGEDRGPATLDEAILGRVGELADETRRLLEVIAVAGRPLPRGVALAAAALRDDDNAALVTLRAARMVSTRGSGSQDEIEPFHDRIREAVVHSLSPASLSAAHGALATALRAAGHGDPETLLEHVVGSGDRVAARELALTAADAAARNLAFRRAARLYDLALELGAPDADGDLHRRKGDALNNAGLGALAAGAYREAARRAPDKETAIELRRLAAEHLLKTGRDEEGLAALREVLGEVGLAYPESMRGAIASLLFHRARLRLSGLEFDERAAHEVAVADRTRADVAYSAAVGLSMLDTLRSADFVSRTLGLALRAGEPVRICRALALEASMTASAGHGARARAQELVAAAEKISYRIGDPHIVAFARLGRAYVTMMMGEWREAQHRFAELQVILRERCHGVSWEIANTELWLCNALILSGEVATATRRARGVLREAYERGDRYTTMHLVYPTTVGHISDDKAPEGRRFLGELMREWTLERYSAGHWGALLSGLSLDRYEGKGAAAWERAQREFPAFEKSFLLRVQIIRTFARFEHGLTAVSAASVTRDRAALITAAERDAKAIRKEATPYAAAMGAHVAGLAAFAKGDLDAAVEHLRAATRGLDQEGMSYLAASARHRLGTLVGGDEGALLEQTAEAYFESQGIVRPEACLSMSAPGAFR